MSFNPTHNGRQVQNYNGHVPVGTGQQVPTRRQPVGVVNHGQHGPNSVNVYRDGQPSRQIPRRALEGMRGRTRYIPPQSPMTVHVQHQGEVRQIPGTEYVVITPKRFG